MAKKKTDKLVSIIEKEVKEAADKALFDMAQKLGFDIEEAYEQTIEAFYSHYRPRYYDRTGGLFKASSGFENQEVRYWGSYLNYNAGIFVDPLNIPNDTYRSRQQYPYINATWIFNRAYDLGIHGFNKADVDVHNRAAKLTVAARLAKHPLSKSYDMLKVWRPTHIPRMEKIAPRKVMERKFKKISRPSNLKKMYNEYIEKYL